MHLISLVLDTALGARDIGLEVFFCVEGQWQEGKNRDGR